MNVQTRNQMYTRKKLIQSVFSAVLLCASTLGYTSSALAQEQGKPKNATELKAICTASFRAKIGCKLAAITIWTDALTGNPISQYKIGNLYRRGYYNGPSQYIKAIKWYARAGEQSHCDAQYWVYTLYKEGAQGVDQDQQESHRWLEKSAITGCKSAFPLYSAVIDTNSYLKTKRMAEAGEKRSQLKLALYYNKEEGIT